MSGKRIALSFGIAIAAGVCGYFIAWGFFTTHPELGPTPAAARTIGICVTAIAFVASLLYFGLQGRRS